MKTTVKITSIFQCSLERAFKTPMLCDVSKVHTGFGIMPKITHCTDDLNWGQPGFTKKVFAAASLTQKGGFASVDKVLERIENQYWKIEVSEFQSWMIGFYKFVGEWKTTPMEDQKIFIEYTYTLYSSVFWLYPFNWLFAQLYWKNYMKKVMKNIWQLIKNDEPYLYN